MLLSYLHTLVVPFVVLDVTLFCVVPLIFDTLVVLAIALRVVDVGRIVDSILVEIECSVEAWGGA